MRRESVSYATAFRKLHAYRQKTWLAHPTVRLPASVLSAYGACGCKGGNALGRGTEVLRGIRITSSDFRLACCQPEFFILLMTRSTVWITSWSVFSGSYFRCITSITQMRSRCLYSAGSFVNRWRSPANTVLPWIAISSSKSIRGGSWFWSSR